MAMTMLVMVATAMSVLVVATSMLPARLESGIIVGLPFPSGVSPAAFLHDSSSEYSSSVDSMKLGAKVRHDGHTLRGFVKVIVIVRFLEFNDVASCPMNNELPKDDSISHLHAGFAIDTFLHNDLQKTKITLQLCSGVAKRRGLFAGKPAEAEGALLDLATVVSEDVFRTPQ
jgi:hypothetical protein